MFNVYRVFYHNLPLIVTLSYFLGAKDQRSARAEYTPTSHRQVNVHVFEKICVTSQALSVSDAPGLHNTNRYSVLQHSRKNDEYGEDRYRYVLL